MFIPQQDFIIQYKYILLRSRSSLNPPTLHQPVIVPHQQVAFNLLQGVQNNAYHNQKGRAAKELRELHTYAD